MKKQHRAEFTEALRSDLYDVTSEGIYFPKQGALFRGEYVHSVNGQDERVDPNLLPDEGVLHALNVVFGATAKISTWYLALYGGAISPAAGWTAASFAATASEITSLTEGYSNATRQTWTPAAAAAGAIDNYASRATFNIVTASTVTVNGAAMLSVNTRGGTTGVLASATRFAAARTMSNGDIFQLGYRITLTS